MKGKPWTVGEEKELRKLVESGVSVGIIAAKLTKTPGAIVKKWERLGLEVVVATRQAPTTTSLVLPKELPSVEEALKMLAGALETACKPGLDKVEIQRLQVVATLARTYEEVLADYLDYRGIESQLLELKEKYELLKEKETFVVYGLDLNEAKMREIG
jgi:hypothetical protein